MLLVKTSRDWVASEHSAALLLGSPLSTTSSHVMNMGDLLDMSAGVSKLPAYTRASAMRQSYARLALQDAPGASA
ncbi:hypothetical protein [Xanthomonas pisi]|nr:hypothetical protein [Xanthomonas pisi]